jgi:type IV pilus assembly protein PilW
MQKVQLYRKSLDRKSLDKASLGYTLVEILIAIVLGIIVTGAVIQSYLTSSQNARINEGVSRVQENGRFANYFLTKDIREAGAGACLTNIRSLLQGDPEDFSPGKGAIFGWEFNGSSLAMKLS